jgi:hypothetical protein
MENEQIITEYNENTDVPFIEDEEKTNSEFSTEEEKKFKGSNVKVFITEPKSNININNDYI